MNHGWMMFCLFFLGMGS